MRKLTLGAVAVVALLGLTLAGVGAAQTYENLGSADMPVNETVTPDDDTETLRVIGENVTNGTADVTVYELQNGSETQVGTGTLDTSATDTTTDSYDFDAVNTSRDYRVLVEGDGADMIAVNKVNVVAAGGGGGGGGGLLSGDLSLKNAAAVLVVVLALVGAVAYNIRD
jgi:hypothetical protein